jgi:hypothetical protein
LLTEAQQDEYETTDDNDPVCLDCGLVGTWTGYDKGLDWVVVGGESGARAREFDVAWAYSIIQQSKAAGVPVFVKQLGAKAIAHKVTIDEQRMPQRVDAYRFNFTDKKGGKINEWPEDLRVREYPVTA